MLIAFSGVCIQLTNAIIMNVDVHINVPTNIIVKAINCFLFFDLDMLTSFHNEWSNRVKLHIVYLIENYC